MKTYESWFTKNVNGMADKGITINKVTYHGYPIRQCKCGAVFSNGPCPECGSGADWRKTTCTKTGPNGKCNSHNAFVFQTNEDPNVFFVFCKKCNKWSIEEGLPDAPAKFVSNVPPPIGSKTKPTKEEIDKVMKNLGF